MTAFDQKQPSDASAREKNVSGPASLLEDQASPDDSVFGVELPVLFALRESHARLESYVHASFASQKWSASSLSVRALLSEGKREGKLTSDDYWRSVENALDLGTSHPPAIIIGDPNLNDRKLKAAARKFKQKHVQSKRLVSSMRNPAQAGEPTMVVQQLWEALDEMSDKSDDILARCQREVDTVINGMRDRLVAIFDRIEQTRRARKDAATFAQQKPALETSLIAPGEAATVTGTQRSLTLAEAPVPQSPVKESQPKRGRAIGELGSR